LREGKEIENETKQEKLKLNMSKAFKTCQKRNKQGEIVEYKENKKERKLKMKLRKREICIVKLAENDFHLRTPFINISMLNTVLQDGSGTGSGYKYCFPL
jgi:hypothetical protein